MFLTRALLWPFRLVLRVVMQIMQPLVVRVDSSGGLSWLIDAISSSMATQRGLPMLVGVAILIVSWIAHGVVLVILVASNRFDSYLYLLCAPFSLLHVGVLAGFIGTLIAIPLGQGYKDK